MNNSAGFSCQVFGFCPRGQLIIVRFILTAGRNSGSSGQHLRTSFCWLNTQRWKISSIQLQFLSRTSKSVEELTQQPDSHHRVALQPPSSFEDGLDGRRERFCLLIFNCLSKAMVFFFTTGETSRALLAQQQVRRFPNLSRIHTTGCFYINYCPRSNFLSWILQNVYCHSSNRSSVVFLPRRERCIFTLAPTKVETLSNQIPETDWSWTAAFCFFWTYLIFFVAPESFPNVKNWTEQ